MAFELLQTQPKPPANKPREKGLQRGRCLRSARRSPVLRPRGSHSVPDSRTQKPPLPRVPPEEAAHPEAPAGPPTRCTAEPGRRAGLPQEDAGAAGEAPSRSPSPSPSPSRSPSSPRGSRAPGGSCRARHPALRAGRARFGSGRAGALRGGSWRAGGRSGRGALGPAGDDRGGRPGAQGATPEPRGRQRPAAAAAPPPAWFLRVRRCGPRQLAPPPRAPLTSHGTGPPGSCSRRARTSPEGSISLRLGPWGSPLWGRLRQREPGLGVRAGGPRTGPREGPDLPVRSRRGKAEPPPPAPSVPPSPARASLPGAQRVGGGGVRGPGSPAGCPGPRLPGPSRRSPPRPPGTGTVARGRAPGFAAPHSPRPGPHAEAGVGSGQLPPRPARVQPREGAPPRPRSLGPARPGPHGGRSAAGRFPRGARAGPLPPADRTAERATPSSTPCFSLEILLGHHVSASRGVRPLRVPPERGGGGRGARRLLPPTGTGAFSGRAPSRTARPGTAAFSGRGTQGPPLPLRSEAAGHGAEGAALAGVPVGPPPPPARAFPPRAFPAAAAASPRAGDPAGAAGREQEREQEQEHEHERPRARLSPHPPVGGRAAGGASVHTAGQHGSARRRRVHTAGRAARSPSAQPRPARAPHVCAPRRALEPALSPGPWPRAVCGRARRPGRGARPGPTGPSDRLTPPSFSPSLISLTPTSLYSYPHLGLETLGFPGPCPCLVATGPGCPQQLPRAGQGGRRPQRA
eukprot:XP_005640451.1 basic proline-rich protein-like [Canis lupus familiaris]